jgi:hypothetical protein
MWFTRKSSRSEVHVRTAPVGCRHTLVLHADGTHECEGSPACRGDELLHEWWVACDELRCGCVGEEHDHVLTWADAA